MEVADQWRKEWAGTAEYGKVTEGGVTRRVARAMEVMHASAPGARVRVMRAAYHSSAGPGTPAASFMLHSSRRVISSGFNLLESPTSSNKPLEISSTPLETLVELNADTDNYKVTEPDDFEISEPSKWRSSKGGSSIRMPSEESSSTDNASIIDLDLRSGKNLHRKYSYDSDSSDKHFGKKGNTTFSLIPDPGITLSTLKYKSLLNNSDEWNTRRKSYSFEDTSPLNETMLHSNDTFAMESSTDSGICKSTEIVNDHLDDNTHVSKYFTQKERKINNNDETFKDWLSRNRNNLHYKTTKLETHREHDIVLEDPIEDNITLQSSGKVSINLPVTVSLSTANHQKTHVTDDERKIKKVEFCKTELHFAAESGKVNIIATDEKPPPSSDFRKRRSAFIPLHDIVDKPITLFGETGNNISSSSSNFTNGEFGEPDENTAATKSILKNKIPKPKPYLLGENMRFGLPDDIASKDHNTNESMLTAVSLVNKQLESEKRDSGTKSLFLVDADSESFKHNIFRTINKGPTQDDNGKQQQHDKHVMINVKSEKSTRDSIDKKDINEMKNVLNGLQVYPVHGSPKTRQLKESDLTYFGVENDRKKNDDNKNKHFENKLKSRDSIVENIFHSVKLIQQVSNSICNSEVESDDSPEYQNIPINTHYIPTPTPRRLSKYDEKTNKIDADKILKTIKETENDFVRDSLKANPRRSKIRRQEELTSNRSLSAPPKSARNNSLEKSRTRDRSVRSNKNESLKENINMQHSSVVNGKTASNHSTPIYVNLNKEKRKSNEKSKVSETNSIKLLPRQSTKMDEDKYKNDHKMASPISINNPKRHLKPERQIDSRNESLQKKTSLNRHTSRTEKIDNIQYNPGYEKRTMKNALNSYENNSKENQNTLNKKKEHRSQLTQTQPRKTVIDTKEMKAENLKQYDQHLNDSERHIKSERDVKKRHRRTLSKDRTNSRNDTVQIAKNLNTNPSRCTLLVPLKNNDKDFNPKPNSYRANKRSEYVINYDDKNGTVSSVTKLSKDLSTPRRKKISIEVLKESPKENITKNKTINKIALLQPEDHQGGSIGLKYTDRNRKTKVYLQRSCQLL